MGSMKNLGFRRADEMDLHIALRAVRVSWIIIMASLLVWSLFDFISTGNLTLPFILLSLGLAVYFAMILYLRKKLSNGIGE